MRTILAPLIMVAIACGGRPIGVLDGQVNRPGDARARDAVVDQSSAFCSAGPRVMIDGELLPVSRVESGPIIMDCCDGWYARFDAVKPAGQRVQVTFSFRWAGGSPPPTPQHFDLSKFGTSASGVHVECDPVSDCGMLNPYDATFEGTLDTTATGAFPGYHIDLCLSATPKDTAEPDAKPVRLSARQQLIVLTNAQCDWGHDQTCNQDPFVSSIKGKCNGDGTCTCYEGAQKVPTTGKCQ